MSSPPQPPIAGGPAGGGPPPPPPYSSPPPQQPYGAQPPQYGSLAPQYGSVAVQPYGPSPAAAAAAPKRRKGLMLSGIAVAVVGIGAGVALVALSGAATERTVEQFARAPVGCTTTLEFEPARKEILFHQARAVANDPDDRACRTKLCAEPLGDLDRLFTQWDQWGWHRVTFYGDLREPVHALADALGWKVVAEA